MNKKVNKLLEEINSLSKSELKTLLEMLPLGGYVPADNIIKKAVTKDVVCEYLTADYGETLGIYPNGSAAIGESVGHEIAENERPIVTIDCWGINNIDDISDFIDDPKRIGNLSDAEIIQRACLLDLPIIEEERQDLINKLISVYNSNWSDSVKNSNF